VVTLEKALLKGRRVRGFSEWYLIQSEESGRDRGRRRGNDRKRLNRGLGSKGRPPAMALKAGCSIKLSNRTVRSVKVLTGTPRRGTATGINKKGNRKMTGSPSLHIEEPPRRGGFLGGKTPNRIGRCHFLGKSRYLQRMTVSG